MHDGAVREPQAQVVGVAEHLHSGSVLLVVVVRAPQRHVDEIGGTAVLERLQVIDFAPCRGDVALLPAAAAVARDKRPILRLGGEANLAAEVEHHRSRVQDALQVGLLGQMTDHVCGNAIALCGDTGLVRDAAERQRVDGDQDGGLLAPAEHLALGVCPAQLHETVGEPLLGGARVALAGLAGDGRDRVVELA